MEKKTINNVVKYGLIAGVFVVAYGGALISKLHDSETAKEIKKTFKLKKQGIKTVKYQEVDK